MKVGRWAMATGVAMICAACSTAMIDPVKASAQQKAQLGHAFAVDHCSSCHALTTDAVSPNPLSPPFEAVVNRPGVTLETLGPWLDNSHYYPDIMAFELAPADVENLAHYMITLQVEDYRPLP